MLSRVAYDNRSMTPSEKRNQERDDALPSGPEQCSDEHASHLRTFEDLHHSFAYFELSYVI